MSSNERKDTRVTTIADYLKCAYPSIAVETFEEDRLLMDLYLLSRKKGFEHIRLHRMSATQKLMKVHGFDEENGQIVWKEEKAGCSYAAAFQFAAASKDILLVAFDFQHMIGNGPSYRSLKDNFSDLKTKGSSVILVAPSWKLPAEISHDVPVIDFALPSREQLNTALQVVISSAKLKDENIPNKELENSCLEAAMGLTLQEAENAYALSVTRFNPRKLDPVIISSEKMKLIKSSGLLELAPAPTVEPGGLGEIKAYVREEVIPVKDDPQLQCRGMIFVGVPGSGKSLCSKAIGNQLQWPVLKMSFGALKGGIVGQSEGNMRAALRLADAVAPCILWCDEVEKGVGGHASSAQSDGGTTLGMLETWLTWLQEHTTPVLTIATCNDYTKLPSELTRAGRFDERFFVDLPTMTARVEIAEAHLNHYGIGGKIALSSLAIDIADMTSDWTGAEIEQLIKSAARRTNRQVTKDMLLECSASIRPIARTKEEDIKQLRAWAKDALRPADFPEISEGPVRRMRG